MRMRWRHMTAPLQLDGRLPTLRCMRPTCRYGIYHASVPVDTNAHLQVDSLASRGAAQLM